MHISFTFKNFEPSEHLRKYARRRMEKLGRFFGKNPALDAQVNMAVDKFRQRVEVQLTGDGINIAASEVSEDMYASIDTVIAKVEKQIMRHRTKLEKNLRAEAFAAQEASYAVDDEEEEEHKVVRVKRFAIKPMDVEEAVLQMELLGHSFYVFENAEDGEVNVLYQRKDGNYGLIEPER